MEERIEAIESKVEIIGNKLTDGFELVLEQLHAFKLVLEQLQSIETKISELKGNSRSDLGTIEETFNVRFGQVIAELKKINHVTGYEDIHKNQSDIKGIA